MVAYHYQNRFVMPTLERIKVGTIRNVGKKRHARKWEALQHYTGSRFHPLLFARSVCLSVDLIRLFFIEPKVEVGCDEERYEIQDLDAFARGDGFADWDDFAGYWWDTSPETRLGPLIRVWIRWQPTTLVALDPPIS